MTSPYCLLETLTPDKENKRNLFFQDFIDILTFSPGDNLEAFFKKAEDYSDKGYWLSGYFAYEFGYFLEDALRPLRPKNKVALAWLGVSGPPDSPKNLKTLGYKIKNLKPSLKLKEYTQQIKKIKSYLEQGLTYQVNFTFKLKFDFTGDALGLYQDLCRTQPTAYAALINTGRQRIVSLSPELFFRINHNQIITRPMKGTASQDFNLGQSQKVKAENIMIVDLLRNDLGKLAQKVWVPKLFKIEKYPTLNQMTSTIKARLKPNLKIKDIFLSLFPCGSVTGAPKIKTMELIRKLENEPRGIYTGAIGYISPKKEACFNVAIRTACLKGKKGELGIGGGIIYDSKARDEYQEALLKARFFIEGLARFCLIETMLLKNNSYFLLNEHLQRLESSCEYFSLPLDLKKLKQKLQRKALGSEQSFKLRVLLDRQGNVTSKKTPLDKVKPKIKIKLSSKRINPDNCFLYHKTTKRNLYDQELKKFRAQGFFEAIFTNIYGQLTEGAISNLFVLKNQKLYTPPVKSGLLPGVLRAHLLNQNKAQEKILYLKDLLEADRIYIGNSLRGLIEAELA
jgi:para-aminobenzoate synthetase/4-amino-4-deoxychorismate lyase